MNALLIAALLAASAVGAQDAPAKSSWSEVKKWFGELRTALAESAVRRQQRHVRGAVAVAAVRGDKQSMEDPAKPYWKGTAASRHERVGRQERAELTKAIDLALEGRIEDALKALADFEAVHPKSALLDDCRQARRRIETAEEPALAMPGALKGSPGPAASGAAAAKADPAAGEGAKPVPVQADEAKP